MQYTFLFFVSNDAVHRPQQNTFKIQSAYTGSNIMKAAISANHEEGSAHDQPSLYGYIHKKGGIQRHRQYHQSLLDKKNITRRGEDGPAR
jgi:hypothetical protein